ncbi:uncharacterized protein LOC121694820 isoform X2 [Alosa sapidissima]|uniref:uncharacterized protein LOC121694820 isoform X2 n=1 Tax=Alosa sapidissima TaxID=34773 RepID=UPI001C0953D1|nr:uncharacterized protein LOC121694820 isoform X2 [Alosa sapidissima]
MFLPVEKITPPPQDLLPFPDLFVATDGLKMSLVAERAVEIWPMISTYVDAVQKKKVPNPNTASYDTILAAQADDLIIPKLQFFLSVARSFSPFLTKYQTDKPVLPFLAKDLKELLMALLRRFVKRELLQDRSSLQIITIQVSEEKNWVSLKNVDIGLGAESAIKNPPRTGVVHQANEECSADIPSGKEIDRWHSSW